MKPDSAPRRAFAVRGGAIVAAMALAAGIGAATPAAALETFDFTGSIVQYTVATSGLYNVTVAGAQGGSQDPLPGCYGGCYWGQGGKGALLAGTLLLQQGQVLDIAVGGQGGAQPLVYYGGDGGHGGGGGSFLVLQQGTDYTPLVVAGGGGGANYGADDGGGGLIGTSGGSVNECPSGYGDGPALGGVNGGGGGASHCTILSFYGSKISGGGGGGFYTDGEDGTYTPIEAGGKSFLDGLAGGGVGGFGGGGGAQDFDNGYYPGGGGGGGYSGGAGGFGGGGGGGGSFFTSDAGFLPDQLQAFGGYNAGNGYITLDYLGPVPEPASWALLIGGFGLAGAALRRRRSVAAA